MVYPVAPGNVQYSGTFIPEIWSLKLIKNFYDASVLTVISNTDYEGEIRGQGDKVKIRTIPEIQIFDYVKGMTLPAQQPDSPIVELLINKGKGFNAACDAVDKIQSDINLLDMWSKDASERMKSKIEADVLSGVLPDISSFNKGESAGLDTGKYNLGSAANPRTLTPGNCVDAIADLKGVLAEQNIAIEYVVVPPVMTNILLKSDEVKRVDITGDSTSPVRNGLVGDVYGVKIYESRNLHKANDAFYIIAGHSYGLTFASQMTEMQYIPSSSNPTAFVGYQRGLQIYGYKVIKPECLAQLIATF